jgi:hypothetical protein
VHSLLPLFLITASVAGRDGTEIKPCGGIFLLLFCCKWVFNQVAALIQYGTTNNIHKQMHITTTNDTYHTRQRKLLGPFTETEHKTTHRINGITKQNEYSHNCINTK